MKLKLAPLLVLGLSAVVAAGLAVMVLAMSLAQPWLGLRLTADPMLDIVWVTDVGADSPTAAASPGQALVAVGGIELRAGDLVEEPDIAETYAEFADFLVRQDRIYEALQQREVELQLSDLAQGAVTVRPAQSRPVTSLPPVFWVLIGTGFACTVIGAWVWSLRLRELSAQLLALAGVSILVSAYPAAIYSTRELALDGEFFRLLSVINHLGAASFGVAMVALLLVYPRRLVPLPSLWLLPLVVGLWWVADSIWWPSPGPPTGFHLLVLLLMAGILGAALWQHRKTRDDPGARAALRWFGLSVGVGAGAFVTIVIAPNLLGMAPSVSQGYAFLLFLFVFAGVAVGVARHRLFELEVWAYRVLFYFGAVMLLLVLDAALVSLVAFERMPAFGVSLIAVALLYLPLRDFLARLLAGRRELDREELFRRLVDIALAPSASQRVEGWQQILGEAFAPLRVQVSAGGPAAQPRIVEDGLGLTIPALEDLPSLLLSYAHGGRRLFSPSDARMAGELCAMLAHAMARRDAYEEGVTAERARIARDIHDNIGAQLLSALHSREGERKDLLIRESLSDLRDIINNADRGGTSLEDTIADLRSESSERLSQAGIELDWRVDGAEGVPLPPPTIIHALRSVLREAISNAIRHAAASRLEVRLCRHRDRIDLGVIDNGKGLPAAVSGGSGLGNMQTRLAALGGSLLVESGATGVAVRATFPLALPPALVQNVMATASGPGRNALGPTAAVSESAG